MKFSELVRQRYSVRAYKNKPIEEEKVNAVLEAARLAPTAANRQPFRLIVIDPKGRESELRRIYDAGWLVEAPLIICACAVPDESWARMDGKPYVDVDIAIAMDHLILAATELGLGTCWIAAFDPDAAREVLGLPEGIEPAVFTPLGYPADKLGAKERKELGDLVRYERW